MNIHFFKAIIILSLMSIVLNGCGGDSNTAVSNDFTEDTVEANTTITAVDPYIVGATFYYDENDNGLYDIGEIKSNATDGHGIAEFDRNIREGGLVRILNKGMHNGTPYEGNLSTELNRSGVISPITTLLSKGFTQEEVIKLLADVGISIAADDLYANPLGNLNLEKTETLEGDLEAIRAAVTLNTFLRMSNYTTRDELTTDANLLKLEKSAALIKKVISPSRINQEASLDQEANLGVIIKIAVAISDFLVEKTLLQKDMAHIDDFINDTEGCLSISITNLINAYTASANIGKNFKLNSDYSVTETIPVSQTYDNFTTNNIEPYGDSLWTPFDSEGNIDWSMGEVTLTANSPTATETSVALLSKPNLDHKMVSSKIKINSFSGGSDTRISFTLEVMTDNTNLIPGEFEYITIDLHNDRNLYSAFEVEHTDGTDSAYKFVEDTSVQIKDGNKYKVAGIVNDDGSATIHLEEVGNGVISNINLKETGIKILGINRIILDLTDSDNDQSTETSATYYNLYAE